MQGLQYEHLLRGVPSLHVHASHAATTAPECLRANCIDGGPCFDDIERSIGPDHCIRGFVCRDPNASEVF